MCSIFVKQFHCALVTNLSCVLRHDTHVHKFHKVSLLQIAARDNRSLGFAVSWSPRAQENCPVWRWSLDCMCPTCILAKDANQLTLTYTAQGYVNHWAKALKDILF